MSATTTAVTARRKSRKRGYSLTRCHNPVRHLRHWQPHPDTGLIVCPVCHRPAREVQPQSERSAA
jgi:hypothetical protein